MSDEEGTSTSGGQLSGQPVRVRLWAVIGPPHSGKSTTIGHLAYSVPTTPPRHNMYAGNRVVALRGGGFLSVFAVPQALQEHNRRLPVEAANWIENQATELQGQSPAINAGWFNVLLALRLVAVTTNGQMYPDGHEYLSYFVRCGWTIQSLFLLNAPQDARDLYRKFGAPISYFDSTRAENQQINFMVGAARNHFGWA